MDHADEQALLASTKAGVSDAARRTMDMANHPSSGCLRKQTCRLQKLHPVVLNYNEVFTNLRIPRFQKPLLGGGGRMLGTRRS